MSRSQVELERWFDDNGLPYFVGDHADRVEQWLSSRRILAVVVLIAAISVGVAIGVGRWLDDASTATAVGLLVLLVLMSLFAGRFLRIGTMVRWAAKRTFGSLGLMIPLLTRALPLLLLAVTFLFINAEVWQVAGLLHRRTLGGAVLFYVLIAVGFLLTRLPEEVRRVEGEVAGDRLASCCAGTPAEHLSVDGAVAGKLPRFARANLVLVLLFSQAIQVLLLSVALFAFFVVFGALTIPEPTIAAWTGQAATELPSRLGSKLPITNELVQVSVFLASFSGLYFTVSAVTDETYRRQFFAGLSAELERAVAVHAVYAALPTDDAN